VLCFQLDYLEVICLILISRCEFINNPRKPLKEGGAQMDREKRRQKVHQQLFAVTTSTWKSIRIVPSSLRGEQVGVRLLLA